MHFAVDADAVMCRYNRFGTFKPAIRSFYRALHYMDHNSYGRISFSARCKIGAFYKSSLHDDWVYPCALASSVTISGCGVSVLLSVSVGCLFSVVFNAAYTPELTPSRIKLLGVKTGMMASGA